jgi:hypothetical protein
MDERNSNVHIRILLADNEAHFNDTLALHTIMDGSAQ